MELLEDRLALEKYFHRNSATHASIEAGRLNAYRDLVNLLFGRGTLYKLEGERPWSLKE